MLTFAEADLFMSEPIPNGSALPRVNPVAKR
jgi:hypothetical protein